MTELMELRQAPVLAERLAEIKTQIEARANELAAMDCTEATKSEVKKARAQFRKDFDELETQRKQIKAAVLAPYEELEKIYRECVTVPFKTADDACTAKIKAVEDTQIKEKTERIMSHFADKQKEYGFDFVTFAKTNIKITLSGSEKDACKRIDEIFADVAKNIEVIKSFDDDLRDGVMAAYIDTLDMAEALRHENAQRQLRREAQKITAKPEEPKPPRNENDELLDEMFADDEPEFEEPRHNFTVRFYITVAEHEKLIALLDASGIPYSGYNGG